MTSSRYRSRDEIIFEILSTAKEYEHRGGANRMKLLYMCRLSSEQLSRYLSELVEQGLLTIDTSKSKSVARDYKNVKGTIRGNLYHITTKGLEWLRMVDEMRQMGIGMINI